MKTVKKIILGFILVLAFISCDTHVGLGTLLDLKGPDLNFTSPVPRKSVKANFVLEGTASDNSGVKTLLVKVEKDRIELPRQWRYSKGAWEISDDFGGSWNPLNGCVWEGDASVIWSIPIDMIINGTQPDDGEYLFSAQAWDSGGVTDDNSFKTLILIIDNDPPIVTIFNPLLYSRYLNYDSVKDVFDDEELQDLRGKSDWREPELIGKFQTNFFTMQWSIEDNFNIWSFDLRFYEMNVPVDNIPQTQLSDDYIYRFHQNTPPAPEAPSQEDYLKPNNSVIVPALDGTPYDYGEVNKTIDGKLKIAGELKKSLKDKTTIRVVAVCYDSANNVAQEKTLGYLIYWPQADIPWITYTGDLKTPEYYDDMPADFSVNAEDAFLVYPGRKMKAIAFHAQGVKEVTFSLYKLEEPLQGTLQESVKTLLPEYNNIKIANTERGEEGSGNYSTSFSWDFEPPPRSAFYIVEAKVLSVSGKESEITKALFKVQDISFPDFPNPVQPPALEPFFKFIDTATDSLTIYGIVSDATQIDSLCLVWINPQSKGFAAQSQLQYFRDAYYVGWMTALEQSPGGSYKIEDTFDSGFPNKVWRLNPTLSTVHPNGINPETQRVEYNFSIQIPLVHLNIGIGIDKQPLKSQVFLLRASNPSPKTTVVTYTPQGDESPPEIKITGVKINKENEELKPGQFGEIDKFKDGDEITINGTWKEDSVQYLDFNKYLKDNFEISINQIPVGKLTFTSTALGNNNGTWQAKAVVGTDIQLADLKDTLVVAAKVKDIGGNVSEDGASWLVKSDTLRLVRISSELPDQTYNAEKEIEIFIEFNKPVRLKNGGSPQINLNVTGGGTTTATYKLGQDNQNTRQYFVYTIQPGQSTTDDWLDVTGLNGLAGGDYWEAGDYPFTWTSTSGTGSEEIRVTMNIAHTEGATGTNGNYWLRRLPVKAVTADMPYTLANGKNIGIDTEPPTITNVSSKNKAGHYALDAEIDIDITFDTPVKLADEANPPQLNLKVTNGGSTTVTTTGSVKVNDKTVTFTYKVNQGDTTGENKLIVDSFTGGGITDIAGTDMAAMNLTEANRTLNGGTANNGSGIYINTIAPSTPTFRALSADNNASIINNTVNGVPVTGDSVYNNNKDLKNYYGDVLWFAIMPNTAGGNNRLGYLEYTLDELTVTNPDAMNWKRIDSTNGAPFEQNIYGKYVVRVRQTDKAGNKSSISSAVSLNWDPGTLITRIDSSTANGMYTKNNSRVDSINITVYFRKKLTFTGTQITLNIPSVTVGNGTDTSTDANLSQLSFTYIVGASDNTPVSQYLDVIAFNITAKDTDGVDVNDFIKLPTSNDDKLGSRKEIQVVTGALSITAGPTYAFTVETGADEATGTITYTFDRPISKRAGEVTVTQQTSDYRLPAVLTEAQANRYKSARNFNTYYSRGTNGFLVEKNAQGTITNSYVDTSTKYILNYAETTVVAPNNNESLQEQMAYDFLQAEKVTLPVTSQDVTINDVKINGSTLYTLTITITGSNALQVLGAAYDIAIPIGLVQDSLGYQWPTAARTDVYTNANINRPFVRVDKKTNEDRITTATGGNAMPHLMANFSRLIQTRARLDCRTPESIVRYTATGAEHSTTAANSSGSNPTNPTSGATTANYWKNTNDNADSLTHLNGVGEQNVDGTGVTVTNYNSFTESSTTHITVGTNTEQGYVWRIGVKSRNGTNGSNNSALYEEIAFRTVLTYELANLTASANLGQNMGSGDQLWIRGGDAIASSSIPNFPINWQDNYGNLNSENKRAGIRLLQRVSGNATNMNTASVWRWITWEINVQTWHDVVMGRGLNTTTAQDKDDAWQYGPRQWAYQRGGWTSLKDQYTLIPGKHRWVRLTNSTYDSGSVNFSLQFSTRTEQTVTYTQPSP